MCEIWDEIRRDGEQKGKLKAEVNSLRQVMKNYNQTLEGAMKVLGYPLKEYKKYKRLLNL